MFLAAVGLRPKLEARTARSAPGSTRWNCRDAATRAARRC